MNRKTGGKLLDPFVIIFVKGKRFQIPIDFDIPIQWSHSHVKGYFLLSSLESLVVNAVPDDDVLQFWSKVEQNIPDHLHTHHRHLE